MENKNIYFNEHNEAFGSLEEAALYQYNELNHLLNFDKKSFYKLCSCEDYHPSIYHINPDNPDGENPYIEDCIYDGYLRDKKSLYVLKELFEN